MTHKNKITHHAQSTQMWLQPSLPSADPSTQGSHECLYRGEVVNFDSMVLIDRLAQIAQQSPQRPALSLADKTLSYGELWQGVERLADWLLNHSGLKAGDRIALYLPNSLSYMLALYAAWRVQMVVVNLGLVSQLDQVQYQLQDSGAKLLLTVPSVLSTLQPVLLKTTIRCVLTTQITDYSTFGSRLKHWVSPKRWIGKLTEKSCPIQHVRLRHLLKEEHAAQIWPTTRPEDIALLQYTSGTTGRPKGAVLTHANLSQNVQQSIYMLGDLMPADARLLCPISLQHVLGLSFVLTMLAKQYHVILTSVPEFLAKPQTFFDQSIHAMLGVPMVYDQLLRQPLDFSQYPLFQLGLCGGSPASRFLQTSWHERTGYYLCEGYGMSETSPMIAANPPQEVRIGSVGKIVPNTQVQLVSPATGQPVGFDQAGELWVKGPQVMQGYWQHVGATMEVMTPDGWLKTGDIMSLSADGYLTMLERHKDVFWVQNQMVFPRELESAAGTHEDVLDCVAVQESHHQKGKKPIRLYVVAREGLTQDVLHQHLTRHLKHIQLPDQIVFVDHLPRGPMGKLWRRLWRDRPSAERDGGLGAREEEGVSQNADNSADKGASMDVPTDKSRK